MQNLKYETNRAGELIHKIAVLPGFERYEIKSAYINAGKHLYAVKVDKGIVCEDIFIVRYTHN